MAPRRRLPPGAPPPAHLPPRGRGRGRRAPARDGTARLRGASAPGRQRSATGVLWTACCGRCGCRIRHDLGALGACRRGRGRRGQDAAEIGFRGCRCTNHIGRPHWKSAGGRVSRGCPRRGVKESRNRARLGRYASSFAKRPPAPRTTPPPLARPLPPRPLGPSRPAMPPASAERPLVAMQGGSGRPGAADGGRAPLPRGFAPCGARRRAAAAVQPAAAAAPRDDLDIRIIASDVSRRPHAAGNGGGAWGGGCRGAPRRTAPRRGFPPTRSCRPRACSRHAAAPPSSGRRHARQQQAAADARRGGRRAARARGGRAGERCALPMAARAGLPPQPSASARSACALCPP
jgi:hypothetical protein